MVKEECSTKTDNCGVSSGFLLWSRMYSVAVRDSAVRCTCSPVRSLRWCRVAEFPPGTHLKLNRSLKSFELGYCGDF